MSEAASELTIRPLHRRDLDRLFNAKSRQFGEDWLERQEGGEVYIAVAELDGAPVARVGLDFISHVSEGAAHLWSAHVEPDFQSRGIGTTLVRHLERVARARGFDLIRLEVGKDNRRAQQLYERLGYAVCGEEIGRWRYRDGDRIVEVVEDCWTMKKRFAPAVAVSPASMKGGAPATELASSRSNTTNGDATAGRTA